MTKSPAIMYHPLEEVEAADTHGQCWVGDTVEGSIELCRHQLIETYFRQYLPQQGKILEAGCGFGRWVFYLRRLGYEIVGIDTAAEALRAVRAYDAHAPIIEDDILHTNFPDRHFGAVISLGVVEHFREGPQKAFAETRRILRDDGLFFVTIPIHNLNRRMIAHPLKALLRWMKMRTGARYAFEEYRYTKKQFSALLEAASFDILHCVPDDFRPPRNIGLYVDYPFLRNKQAKWELNALGNALRSLSNSLSPWLACGGALWICRKRI